MTGIWISVMVAVTVKCQIADLKGLATNKHYLVKQITVSIFMAVIEKWLTVL